MDTSLPIDLPPELEDLFFDDELGLVLMVAAVVGRKSGDEALCSYTSMMIGMLWCTDRTSAWMQRYARDNATNVDGIYARRDVGGSDRDNFVKMAMSGARQQPPEGGVNFSRSAITMLRNAAAIRDETGHADMPLRVRDLLATYVFRNPASHAGDLHTWNVDEKQWAQAFAEYIRDEYGDEAPRWEGIFAGYLQTDDADSAVGDVEGHPGDVLSGYRFLDGALQALRATEQYSNTGGLFSEGVIDVLLNPNAAAPECADLRFAVFGADDPTPNRSVDPLDWPTDAVSFADAPLSAMVGPGLRRVLDRARTLALSTTGREDVGLRHLIASIVIKDDSQGYVRMGAEVGSLTGVRRTLHQRFTRRATTDDGYEWQMAMIGETTPSIAGYTPDIVGGTDLLDVSRYASAFATVIAANDVRPPLSIGVFGDWGSGKSFFMDLVEKQTRRVVRNPEKSAAGRRLFCENVLAIRFNAWHYAEANLWASIVQTIFEKLIEAMKKEKGPDPAEKLALVQAAQLQARRRLDAAEGKQKLAKQARKDAERRRNDRQSELNDVGSQQFIADIGKEVLQGGDVEEALRVIGRYVGVEGAESTTRTLNQLKDVLARGRRTAADSLTTWQKLRNLEVVGPLAATSIIAAAIAVAVVALVPIEVLAGISRRVAQALAGGVALLGTATAWVQKGKDKFEAGLRLVDGVRSRIDARIDALTQETEAEYREAFEEAEIEFEAAAAALAIADTQVQAAQDELEECAAPRRIARLIERRLQGRDYEDHLSIVTTIRRDFEELADMLERQSDRDGVDGKYNRIDRIMLYIDDLDRCPSDQVVSVLEAIHLMLAYPLFVVVVGVDIRWARKSLHERYPLHLDAVASDDDGADTVRDGASASALDYLEKIFQIPFWIPPMEEDASLRMIGALLPAMVDSGSVGSADTTNAADGAAPVGDKTGAAGVEQRQDDARGKTVTGAAALGIAPLEREFMLSLAGAVGKSPRRLKRFVNSYRILKASCDALESEEFVNDDGATGTYPSPMMLLAVATGAPLKAIEFLRAVADRDRFSSVAELRTFVDDLNCVGDAAAESGYLRCAVDAYLARKGEDANAITELRYWAPRVARFSFRSGRI